MSADKGDREAREHFLDALWRLGLEDLVGKAEAPDRVWANLRDQVGAGPPRSRSPSRGASSAWRAVSQFVALAAVLLLLLGVRAEVVQRGSWESSFWEGRFPTPWAWRAPAQPVRVGVGDTLSAHTTYALARERRALAALRYPSQDPLLRNQGAGSIPAAQGTASFPVPAPQPREEPPIAPRADVFRTLGEPARDPLLARRTQ